MPPDSVRGLPESDHDLLIRIEERLRIMDKALQVIIQSLESLRLDHGKRITALESRALPTTEYRDYVIRSQKREDDYESLAGEVAAMKEQMAVIRNDLAPVIRRQEDAQDARTAMNTGTRIAAASSLMVFIFSIILLFAQHIHFGP